MDKFLISDFSIEVGMIIGVGIVSLLIVAYLIEKLAYDIKTIEIMKKHDVVNALIHKNRKAVKFVYFPLTMVMEEFIFRYYLISFLVDILNRDYFWGILMSSIIFSFYHIHIWFGFRNVRITCIYMVYSFLLGLFLGFVLLTIGFAFCVLVHYSLVFFIYFNLSKKIKKG